MSTVTAARMTVAGRAARASTEARNTKPSPPISRVESKKAQGAVRRASLTRTRATDEKDAKTSIDDETVSETVRRRREASKASKETAQAPTLNPLDLGRRARQLTDGFFKGITGITQLARAPSVKIRTERTFPIRSRRSSGTSATPRCWTPPCRASTKWCTAPARRRSCQASSPTSTRKASEPRPRRCRCVFILINCEIRD